MKQKTIIIILVLALLFVIIPKDTYKIKGIITDRNEITDSAGHIWEYDTNGFRVGDNVVITFQEKGTTSRTDDIIKNIQ